MLTVAVAPACRSRRDPCSGSTSLAVRHRPRRCIEYWRGDAHARTVLRRRALDLADPVARRGGARDRHARARAAQPATGAPLVGMSDAAPGTTLVLRVPDEADGLRLDRFLADASAWNEPRSRCGAGSRTASCSSTARRPRRPASACAAGIELERARSRPPRRHAPPWRRSRSRSLHEDADLVVVDKPAGLVVHPGHGPARGTLVNALLGRGTPLAAARSAGSSRDRPPPRRRYVGPARRGQDRRRLRRAESRVRGARACASATWRSCGDGSTRPPGASSARSGAAASTRRA